MIKVAILGAGIGAQHLEGYRKLPDHFTVTRLIDRDLHRARNLCANSDIAISSEISDALTDPNVDVVDICLPPHLHASITQEALRHGKHVICEKPIAASMTEVEALRLAAAAADHKIYPVFQYRWGTAITALKHLVQSGLAGKPLIASAETHWSRDATYYEVPWRGTWNGELGGAIVSHAIHIHDLLSFIMGPIGEVTGFCDTRVNPIETEDCAALAFRFANGALATSSITLGAATNETRLRFVFSKLTATSGINPYAPGQADWRFVAREVDKQAEVDRAIAALPAKQQGFEGFLLDVARDITGEYRSSVGLNSGAISIELATGIYHAVRSGTSVRLPLPEHHPLHKGWKP